MWVEPHPTHGFWPRNRGQKGQVGQSEPEKKLIPTDEWKVSDHEFRVLHGNGYWYALYSIAKKGHRQLACLAFERNGGFTEDTKPEMWRVLELAEKLSRELLAEKDAER